MAEGGAMEELVELAWLLDFYGARLTEKRRRIVEMRVNEDMTLAEIADACQMTRQGAYDAFAQARKQLKAYEATLGLAGRYRQIQAALAECLRPLLPVQKDNEELDLAETLAVFLLDGESSVTMTSELLYLHKNTVKYRIRRISNLLGYKPDKMPEMLELYKACAVKRLLLDE